MSEPDEEATVAKDSEQPLLTDGGDLVADGGLPTCETCGETFTHETIAGPGEARRSCGCAFVPEFEVPDDTENAFANAAIRAANVTGDAETAALIREDERGRLVTDGGTSWFDLTAFKRDCLQTLARMENDGDRMHGLGMKSRLEERYGSEINHGQIYPNLDDLVAAGLIEKKALDKRTNSYTLTDAGWRMLREQREAWTKLEIQRVAVADGGEGE